MSSLRSKINHLRGLFFLHGLFWLQIFLYFDCQGNPSNADLFKEFFSNKPAIANLVFERTVLKDDGTFGPAKFYQCSLQGNKFCIRQITTIADTNNLQITNPEFLLAGANDSNFWVIEGVVKLFPVNDEKDLKSPESSYFRFGKNILFQVLNEGLRDLDTSLLQWNGDFFTGRLPTGETIKGNISDFSEGRPKKLSYQYDGDPRKFYIEYDYNNDLVELPFFPSERTSFMILDGHTYTTAITKVHLLKKATMPLDKILFEPATYVKNTSAKNALMEHTVLYKEGKGFHVLPNNQLSLIQSHLSNSLAVANPWIVRIILLIVALVPPTIFFYQWEKKQNKK